MGADSFLYVMTTIYMGGNIKNDRVAFPESEHIHLNAFPHLPPEIVFHFINNTTTNANLGPVVQN